MLSYLDFITLMMIFFLMMYAISNVDTKKSQTLANSLKIGFNSGNGENVIAVSDSSNSPPTVIDQQNTQNNSDSIAEERKTIRCKKESR